MLGAKRALKWVCTCDRPFPGWSPCSGETASLIAVIRNEQIQTEPRHSWSHFAASLNPPQPSDCSGGFQVRGIYSKRMMRCIVRHLRLEDNEGRNFSLHAARSKWLECTLLEIAVRAPCLGFSAVRRIYWRSTQNEKLSDRRSSEAIWLHRIRRVYVCMHCLCHGDASIERARSRLVVFY